MHVREVTLLVFRHAQGSGLDVSNPAESIRTSAIATFEPRDRALAQDPYFDYAEALLQIAIVLISVAIVANLGWLAFLGGAVGVVGALLAVNGFLLLVEIPGLS